MSSAIPPRILGTAAFKTMQSELAKIDEMVGAAVGELSGCKGAVEAASTASLTLSGEQTIDGVAVVAGELVLAKDQSTGSQNGIYVCKADAWERSSVMPVASSASGVTVYVTKGTVNADKLYICSNDIGSGIVGTSALVFDLGVVTSTTPLRMKSTSQNVTASTGTTARTFTDTFCTTSSIITGNWASQGSAASILTIAPGSGSFIVTSTADPVSGVLSYTITK